jgi:ubiquinone/menaquinone biosynthesis C-methylase UbiE
MSGTADPDHWMRWLLDRRDAGDPQQRAVSLGALAKVRDRVLAGAEPLDGATVLDVGTGDGLIGLEALERVGAAGTVIFSDVSEALLNHVRDAVRERSMSDRSRFVHADAAELALIDDQTVDVVTTRSVLIYVADKANALAAMHRVLRPGGRISLFEPINRLMSPEPRDRFCGYDVAAVRPLADRVKAAYNRLKHPSAATMIDFDDRDLVRFAETAGFERIHLECHIDIEPGSLARSVDNDALLGTSPNPLAPTVAEVLADALGTAEREAFIAHLARAIASGDAIRRSAVAYLTAVKPTRGRARTRP